MILRIVVFGAMMKAYKLQLEEPISFNRRNDNKPVFYRIQFHKDVLINDILSNGSILMKLVTINMHNELENPEYDLIAMVGYVVMMGKNNVRKPQLPRLWYWNDLFWVQAVDVLGVPYYRNKQSLLYQVAVKDQDELFNFNLI